MGYGTDSASMLGQPGNEQILAERSAGGCLSLPKQGVLSPQVEGGVGVVKGACKMIKRINENKAPLLNMMRHNRETERRQ